MEITAIVKKILTIFLFLALILNTWNTTFAAGEASLSLSPASGSYIKDSVFDVGIKIDTGSTTVGGVDCIISYDQTKLSIEDITENENWGNYPAKSASNGTIVVSTYSDTGVTGAVTIATIKFKALVNTGTASVSYVTGVAGLVSSVIEKGTSEEILGTTSGGSYTLTTSDGSTGDTEDTGGTDDTGTTPPTQPATGIMDGFSRGTFAAMLLILSGKIMLVVKKRYY